VLCLRGVRKTRSAQDVLMKRSQPGNAGVHGVVITETKTTSRILVKRVNGRISAPEVMVDEVSGVGNGRKVAPRCTR